MHISFAFLGLAVGSLIVATWSGEDFKIPLRPYFATLLALVTIGAVLRLADF